MNKGLNIFTFNGTSLCRDGVYIFPDYANMDSPEKEQTTAEIPGRHGSLLLKKFRYKNKTIGYHIISYAGINYYDWVENLLMSTTGYARLEDSVDLDVYRKARCTGITPPVVYPDVVKFAITLDAMPQRWLKTGEQVIDITNGTTLYNETQFDARPLITVTGAGTLTFGNKSYQCAQSMIIDSDAQDAYGNNGENLNSKLTINGADFPVLSPGVNNISCTGFSSVKIIPRWWRL